MTVETPAFMGMLRRMIGAAGRRVADGDEPELRDLLALYGELDRAVAEAVAGWRAMGRSWAWIARATGTSRQAAQQRWGAKMPPEVASPTAARSA